MMLRKTLHRALRRVGLQISRSRDPYEDCVELLGPNSVALIVDGGAFHGGHALQMARLFPAATIHLFEPTADTFATLQTRISGAPRLRAHRLALSDRTMQTELHVHQTRFTSSLLPTNEPTRMREVETQHITAVSLDEWLATERLPVPDIIKLDLQGHELAALRGATSSLSSGVRGIVVEVNFRNRYSGGCTYYEVAQLLSDHGFRLFRFYDVIADGNGAWRQADALFVRMKLLESHAANRVSIE